MDSIRGMERLIEVGDDVVDVLDSYAQPDHLGPYAGLFLLFWRHLPVRGRCGMAGERFRVANVDQPLEQFERIVEPLAGLEPSSHAEGQQRTRPAAQILLRQRVGLSWKPA